MRLRAFLKYGAYDDIYALFEEHEAGMLAAKPNLDVDFAKSTRIQTCDRGFRSPSIEVPATAGKLRLAFLGGSTTFCAQATHNERTWPARLIEILSERHPDIPFDFVNASVTGASVETSRLTAKHRLRGLDVDLIVITHAAKDLADDTRELAIEAGVFEAPPAKGWLERNSKFWMLVRKNLRHRSSIQKGRAEGAKLEYDADQLAETFEARLAELVRVAQQTANEVAVATFTVKTRADQDEATQVANLTQAFTFTPYLTPQGVLQGYAAYNRAIERVAEAEGALLIAGHADLPGTDEYFHDSVHFTEKGYEAMAQRFADQLEASGSFQALLETARSEKEQGQ